MKKWGGASKGDMLEFIGWVTLTVLGWALAKWSEAFQSRKRRGTHPHVPWVGSVEASSRGAAPTPTSPTSPSFKQNLRRRLGAL